MSDLDVLRGGRLAGALGETLQFTSSVSDDRILVNAVRKINIVHLLMLLKKGLIKKKDAMACIQVLDSMPEDFPLNVELEDVHMNIEAYVSSKAGDDSGGQMNLGKSRNDQVATAIRMVSREILLELLDEIIVLERTLLEIAKANTDMVFPAYTHLQRAQVVTISHYFLAYHDAIARDLERLMECYSRVNASPMGAGAVATVILDLDREYVAHLLGFAGILENSVDAVTARDFLIEILSLLSLLMTDVERFANEIILWTSSEFSFIEIPDEFASTSSIMPQKKNAVVAEVIRSKSSMIFGDLAASIHMMKSLPLGYNLDYQDMTPKLWDGLKNARASVRILGKMLKKTVFKKDQIEKG
ncbi:MAG: argininosuccinate lyase, partial [Nitrososphaerales archaeon]